jgi:hypothetical protein
MMLYIRNIIPFNQQLRYRQKETCINLFLKASYEWCGDD